MHETVGVRKRSRRSRRVSELAHSLVYGLNFVLRIGNGSDVSPSKQTELFMLVRNYLVMLRSLQSLKYLEQTNSANKIKRLSQVNESQIQRLVLLSTFFIELSHRKDHVNSGPSISKAALLLWIQTFSQYLASTTLAKTFPTILSRVRH